MNPTHIQPVILVVCDGLGENPSPIGNAVRAAKTPNLSRFLERYTSTQLLASGSAVGLPPGFMGSSEVGHLAMGAGRVVEQELKRIGDCFEQGTFFQFPNFRRLEDSVAAHHGAVHLMGLVQDEGVHAHQDHLFRVAEHLAKNSAIDRIWIHFFADGRDSLPRSGIHFLRNCLAEMDLRTKGKARLATLMGRYYAMDRGRDWSLTTKAFNALVCAQTNLTFSDPVAHVEQCYAKLLAPDGGPVTDEYLPVACSEDYAGMNPGDGVLHTNYRQDRAIQLMMMFLGQQTTADQVALPKPLSVSGMTQYYDQFPFGILPPIGEGSAMANIMGEYLSHLQLPQLRLAETQKFRHVTSFFNCKRVEPFAGEDRLEITSTIDSALYARFPAMEAERITKTALQQIARRHYRFILINYANCDMVGHTGDMAAAIRAVESVDTCLGQIETAALQNGYEVLLTADHGNVEEMIDSRTGLPKTSHTTFPVRCYHLSPRPRPFAASGTLGHIAPTLLTLLGLTQPTEMTLNSLME